MDVIILSPMVIRVDCCGENYIYIYKYKLVQDLGALKLKLVQA